MGSSSAAAAVLFCVVLSVVAAASAEPEQKFISMAALKGTEEAPSSSRKLFGFARGFCPVAFDEMKRMGKIASKCKGQEMPNAQCCAAFKDFACPYTDLLDQLTNGCYIIMLDKIQTFCSVPMGYFAFCGDSEFGISCPIRG